VTTAWVTHRFVGFHSWPDAPGHRDYLAQPHRHLFHVRASLSVTHDDRDVEFHDLLAVVVRACVTLGTARGGARYLGAMSCEHVARRIVEALAVAWPGRLIEVDVSEDGEAGATVTLPAGPPNSPDS
jgi:hypothetical protein